MTGNKGEWSEFYTFIKLLADKKIVAADAELRKNDSLYFPILSILRNENNSLNEYKIANDEQVNISSSGTHISVFDARGLNEKATSIFNAIKSGSKTFEIPAANQLMAALHVTNLKAGNNRKEDITLKIHDLNTQTEQTAGFSIKSMLGSPATLLNASGATNFQYKLVGCTDDLMSVINSIDTRSKIRDRVLHIKGAGISFEFQKVNSAIFADNLRIIESTLPLILSEYVLSYYSNNGAVLSDLSESVLNESSLLQQLGLSEVAYTHKIKTFLHAIALGMVPASRWDGEVRAHGGYIVVREDGEIVCYHVFNADQFREYLFKNVKFDSPSARHKYGLIYKELDEYYINLNIQVRFIK